MNHVFYLLQCILEVTNIVQGTITTILIRQNHVLHGKINEIESIESIHKWVINNENPKNILLIGGMKLFHLNKMNRSEILLCRQTSVTCFILNLITIITLLNQYQK